MVPEETAPTLEELPEGADFMLSDDQAFVLLPGMACFVVRSDGQLARLSSIADELSPAVRPVSRETWLRAVRDEIVERQNDQSTDQGVPE